MSLALCPGSRGGGEREPGTHRSRMRLIISNFCRFLHHRRLPTTTAMLRNNINKLAAKLLSFCWTLLGYASLVIYTIELNVISEQCSKFISGNLAEQDSKPSLH